MGLKAPSVFMIWVTQKKEILSNQQHLQVGFFRHWPFLAAIQASTELKHHEYQPLCSHQVLVTK